MVYLVDDDIDDLEIIQAALVQNSYKGPVRTATNGQLFMNDLREMNGSPKPRVVILDLNMPLKDGFQVLREMKSHQAFHSIPIIVLTSSQNKSDEIRCLELGCSLYFTKPYSLVDYDTIASAVKRFVAANPA